MTLPTNETCVRVLKELEGDPGLSQWESDFVDSNRYRVAFSDAQREVIARLMDEFEV